MTSSDRLDRAVRTAATRTAHLLSRHPRSLTAAVVLALGGFGATAFGVAPLTADEAAPLQRLITETVTLPDLAAQTESLALHELSLYRSDLTRGSDTADSLLRRLNVTDPAAAAFLRSDAAARQLFDGRAGKMVQLRTDDFGRVHELIARYPLDPAQKYQTEFVRLRIERVAGGLRSRIEVAPLVPQVRLGSGTLRTTFYAAADDANLPDAVAGQLAEMFSTEIDFQRELKKGDTFTVIYQALTADGEPVAWANGDELTGRVLAAEVVGKGRTTYSAVWFDGAKAGDDPSGKSRGGYFGFNGQNKKRAFLASPLAFTRITSGFEMRLHPILQTWRAHRGVDYGAPTGTPVRSIGDGTVEFAGWQNGYGNVVHVKHSNDRTTVYAHLNDIEVQKGQRIDQGATLGSVGATGWATGPHLHFEFRIKDEQQDPMEMAQASEAVVIPPAAKARFAQVARQARAELQAAASVAVAGRVAVVE